MYDVYVASIGLMGAIPALYMSQTATTTVRTEWLLRKRKQPLVRTQMSLPTEVKKMDMISEGMTNYPDKVIATMLSEEEEA